MANSKQIGRGKKKPAHVKYNARAKYNGWDGNTTKAGKKHRSIKHIHG